MIFPGIQVKVVNSYAPVSDDLFFGGVSESECVSDGAHGMHRTSAYIYKYMIFRYSGVYIHVKVKVGKELACVCAFYREWREDVNV